MFQLYIFVKKSRTTLSQIQLFNTSRCKSVVLEYTFLSLYCGNMHSSIVSWYFRRIHFECSIHQIRIVSIFSNLKHNSFFSIRVWKRKFWYNRSSTRINHVFAHIFQSYCLFIWKFFFPFGRFPRGWLELLEKEERTSCSISNRMRN